MEANPRAVIGDNEPPLADRLAIDHADLIKSATAAADLVPAQIRAIETDEEAEAYTDTAADILDIVKDADKAFKVEKQPWLDGGRTVEAFFAFRVGLNDAVKRVKAAIDTRNGLLLAAQRKREAEEARIAQEAAAAETERLRKEALAFDEPAPEAVVVAWVPPAPVKDVVRIVSSSGAKASGSIKWDYRITEFDNIPRHYLMENKQAITAAIAGLKARGMDIKDAKIPGLEIFEAVKTAIRR